MKRKYETIDIYKDPTSYFIEMLKGRHGADIISVVDEISDAFEEIKVYDYKERKPFDEFLTYFDEYINQHPEVAAVLNGMEASGERIPALAAKNPALHEYLRNYELYEAFKETMSPQSLKQVKKYAEYIESMPKNCTLNFYTRKNNTEKWKLEKSATQSCTIHPRYIKAQRSMLEYWLAKMLADKGRMLAYCRSPLMTSQDWENVEEEAYWENDKIWEYTDSWAMKLYEEDDETDYIFGLTAESGKIESIDTCELATLFAGIPIHSNNETDHETDHDIQYIDIAEMDDRDELDEF